MFGAEKRHQLHVLSTGQDVNGSPPFEVNPRLVGDQSDALATQKVKGLLFEHIHTDEDPTRGERLKRPRPLPASSYGFVW